jgi:uncharacterized protein YjdB
LNEINYFKLKIPNITFNYSITFDDWNIYFNNTITDDSDLLTIIHATFTTNKLIVNEIIAEQTIELEDEQTVEIMDNYCVESVVETNEATDELLYKTVDELMIELIDKTMVETVGKQRYETVDEPIIETVNEHIVEMEYQINDEIVDEPNVETVNEQCVENIETMDEPKVETVNEQHVESVVESIFETVDEPIVKTVNQQYDETIVEPIVETVNEQIVETVNEQRSELIDETVNKQHDEHIDETVDEPNVETVNKQHRIQIYETVNKQQIEQIYETVNKQHNEQIDKTVNKQYGELIVETVDEPNDETVNKQYCELIDETVNKQRDEQNDETVNTHHSELIVETVDEPNDETVNKQYIEQINEIVNTQRCDLIDETVNEHRNEHNDETVDEPNVETVNERRNEHNDETVDEPNVETVNEHHNEHNDETVNTYHIELIVETVDEPNDETVNKQYIELINETVNTQRCDLIDETVDEPNVENVNEHRNKHNDETVDEPNVETVNEHRDEHNDETVDEPNVETVNEHRDEHNDETVDEPNVETVNKQHGEQNDETVNTQHSEQIDETVDEPNDETVNKQQEEMNYETVYEPNVETVNKQNNEQIDETVNTQNNELIDETVNTQNNELIDETVNTQNNELIDETVDEPNVETVNKQNNELIDETVNTQNNELINETVNTQNNELIDETVDEPNVETVNKQHDEHIDETVNNQNNELIDETVDEPTVETVNEHSDEHNDETADEPNVETVNKQHGELNDETVNTQQCEQIDETVDEPNDETVNKQQEEMNYETVYEPNVKTVNKQNNEQIDETVNTQNNELIDETVNAQNNELIDETVDEPNVETVNKQHDEHIDETVNNQNNELIDETVDEPNVETVNKQHDEHIDETVNNQNNDLIHETVDEPNVENIIETVNEQIDELIVETDEQRCEQIIENIVEAVDEQSDKRNVETVNELIVTTVDERNVETVNKQHNEQNVEIVNELNVTTVDEQNDETINKQRNEQNVENIVEIVNEINNEHIVETVDEQHVLIVETVDEQPCELIVENIVENIVETVDEIMIENIVEIVDETPVKICPTLSSMYIEPQLFSFNSFIPQIPITNDNNIITYYSSDESIASVNSITCEITMKKAGIVIITASIKETENYTAKSTNATLIINKAQPLLSTFNIDNQVWSNVSFIPPQLPITNNIINYSSSDETIATVNPITCEITMKKAGIVIISASIQETENYTAKSTNATLIINKAQPSLSTFNIDNQVWSNVPFIPSQLPITNNIITYYSSDETIALVNSNTCEITMKKAGVVIIIASVQETDTFTYACTYATLTINKACATLSTFNIDCNFWNNKLFIPYQLPITNSDGSIIYLSCDESIASVNSKTCEITLKKAGIVTITASVLETEKYTYVNNSATLTINKAIGTLSTFIIKPQQISNIPFIPQLPITNSDGNILYSCDNPLIANINTNTGEITMNKYGSIIITALVPETEKYTGVSTTSKLIIARKNATLSNFYIENKILGINNRFIPILPITNSNGNIIYSSSDSTIATINNIGEITMIKGGLVTITAYVSETDIYTSVITSTTFNIKIPSTLSSFSIDNKIWNLIPFTPILPKTNSDGNILYSSSDETIAKINNVGEITMISAGTVKITAYVLETLKYTSASTHTLFTIDKVISNISTFNIPNQIWNSTPFTPILPTTNSDGKILYKSSDESIASINVNTGEITMITAGSVKITAYVLETSKYTTTSINTIFIIDKMISTISSFNIPNQIWKLDPFTPILPTTNSDGLIIYQSSNKSIATININTGEITLKAYGIVTITATVQATNKSTEISACASFIINKATPKLSKFTIKNKILSANPFTPQLPIVTGGKIIYLSSNKKIATINSSTGEITMLKPGNVTITAALVENNHYTSDIYETSTFTIINDTFNDDVVKGKHKISIDTFVDILNTVINTVKSEYLILTSTHLPLQIITQLEYTSSIDDILLIISRLNIQLISDVVNNVINNILERNLQ